MQFDAIAKILFLILLSARHAYACKCRDQWDRNKVEMSYLCCGGKFMNLWDMNNLDCPAWVINIRDFEACCRLFEGVHADCA